MSPRSVRNKLRQPAHAPFSVPKRVDRFELIVEDGHLHERTKSLALVHELIEIIEARLHLRDWRTDVGRCVFSRTANEVLIRPELARMSCGTPNSLH